MNKETFLELLTNHNPEEINDIIKEKGKLKLMNGLIFKEEKNNDNDVPKIKKNRDT